MAGKPGNLMAGKPGNLMLKALMLKARQLWPHVAGSS
jgi:hypothetical protein